MKVAQWIKSILPYSVISVIIESNECTIRHEVLKNGKWIKEVTKRFRSFGGLLSKDAIDFIQAARKEHKFTYIATILGSINQGAVASCSKQELEKYKIDQSTVDTLCIDDAWSVYGYSEDIHWTKSVFNDIGGIDYIFSPFLILYSFFESELDDTPRMYILAQRSSVTVTVISKKKLLYGVYFILTDIEDPQSDHMDEDEEQENTEQSQREQAQIEQEQGGDDDDLDELISLDDELEEIGGLEDLDEGDKLEEFEDDSDDESSSEASKKSLSPEQKSSIDDFAKGMDMLNFIKNSLNEFYENPLYESDFISEVVLADGYGVTDDIVSYIHEMLLLEIKVKKVDIPSIVSEMALQEMRRAV